MLVEPRLQIGLAKTQAKRSTLKVRVFCPSRVGLVSMLIVRRLTVGEIRVSFMGRADPRGQRPAVKAARSAPRRGFALRPAAPRVERRP